MSVLAGFDDLKAKDVLVFNSNGTILVVINDKVEMMQMQIAPTGCLTARPIEKQQPDQVQERKKIPVALRWANTDQGQSAMERGEM